MQPRFHRRPDPAKVAQLECVQCLGQVALLDHVEAIGLVHVRRGLGQELVGRDPDRAGQAGAEALSDRALDVPGDAFRVVAPAFAPEQPARHLIDRGRLAVRNAGGDRLEELLVHLEVARWPRDLQRDVGAALQRFGDAGAGLDPVQLLGFLARGDAAGGRARNRDHRDRAIPQMRRVVLLHRGEEGIEIDEQAAQRHRKWPGSGTKYPVGVSRRPTRIS